VTTHAHSQLLSPIRIGRVEVRNRVVSTAHGAFLDFYRPGISPDQYIAYQERRAQGGCGLIILQPMHVHPSSHALGHFVPDPDDIRKKFAAMADAVHRHGARIVVQLMHFGAQFTSDARDDLQPLWSLSGTVSPEGEPSHAMLDHEIGEVIEGFANSAALAVDAGLDGVEVHAAHGYLVQQSISPWANHRDDLWGDRLRFLDSVLEAVRTKAGAEAVVGLRLAADDFVRPERGGVGVEGLKQIAQHATSSGHIDYLNHSEGARSSHYARAVGSYRHPRGEFLPLAAGLRRAIGAAIPVIGVGRIVDPAMAERALVDGTCDLVGLTRAQIADPDFVEKCKTGETHLIRACVGANQGCVDRMSGALPITCFHNPDVGREHRLAPIRRVADPKGTLVIGAGPAGLKAAEIAARRGHEVTVVDRSRAVGGLLRCVETLGPSSELLDSVGWIEQQLSALGVEIMLGVEADEEFISTIKPEVVILATGASPDPTAPGPHDGSVPILSTADAAWSRWEGERYDAAGQQVVVVDTLGSLETALVIEALTERGASVTVVTPYLHFGPHVGFTHRRDLLEKVYQSGCRVETSSVFTGLVDGEVTWRHIYSRQEQTLAVDALIAGVPRLPDLSLLEAARGSRAEVMLIGDAVAPRSAMHAFREGDNAGRAI
jgi:2,4-dienoyl-CoA reductase-like NADH-dependent reductase (Old Yellow Enzyme family)/thioredoxin reductase